MIIMVICSRVITIISMMKPGVDEKPPRSHEKPESEKADVSITGQSVEAFRPRITSKPFPQESPQSLSPRITSNWHSAAPFEPQPQNPLSGWEDTYFPDIWVACFDHAWMKTSKLILINSLLLNIYLFPTDKDQIRDPLWPPFPSISLWEVIIAPEPQLTIFTSDQSKEKGGGEPSGVIGLL